MTHADMPRWTAALRRLAACYNKTLTAEQADAWFEQLERYPIDAIEQAMRDAPAHDDAGQYMPSVGLVEKITRKHMGGTPRSTGDWHAPDVSRDPTTGLVVARWRCVFCEDTGWRAVRTEDGRVLTQAELIAWEATRPLGAREDGQPHSRMRRCDCRGRQEVAA